MKLRLLILLTLGALSARGQVLISFDANLYALTSSQNPSPTEVQANTVDPAFNNTVTLNRGSGLTAQSATHRFIAASFVTGGESVALQQNTYFVFTLNPVGSFDFDGYSLSLVTQSAASGPGTLGIYTSIAGFQAGNALETLSLQRNGAAQSETIDLSTLGTVSGPVEIRLYGYAGGTGQMSINDLDIVAVPEPSTTGALVVGGALLGVWLGGRHWHRTLKARV